MTGRTALARPTLAQLSPAGRLYDEVDLLAEMARLAPSPMNVAPWRLRAHDGGVDLILDVSKVTAEGPTNLRNSLIACGGALLNLRLTTAHLGLEPRVALLPHGSTSEVVARIDAGGPCSPSVDDGHLLSMLRRRTRRTPFTGTSISGGVVDALTVATAAEGAMLQHLTGVRATELDILIVEAERSSAYDPARRAGMRARWSTDSFRATVLAVCTGRDEPIDWVRSGQGMQRMLLTATSLGLVARFFTLALEDPDQREQVRRQVCAGRHPQVLLELGSDG